jgi:hypothetical protein
MKEEEEEEEEKKRWQSIDGNFIMTSHYLIYLSSHCLQGQSAHNPSESPHHALILIRLRLWFVLFNWFMNKNYYKIEMCVRGTRHKCVCLIILHTQYPNSPFSYNFYCESVFIGYPVYLGRHKCCFRSVY